MSFASYGPTVQVSAELVRDASPDLTPFISVGIREAFLDLENPRFGPRSVLNDEQQADLDRRTALAAILLDLAGEWGVTDLVVRGDDYDY